MWVGMGLRVGLGMRMNVRLTSRTGVCPDGEWFVLAFHSPKDALLFVMKAQVRQQASTCVGGHGGRGGFWDALGARRHV